MVRVIEGRYERCTECEAPWIRPLPEGWTYTVIGLWGLGHLVSPHKPGCPNRFIPVEVPDAD